MSHYNPYCSRQRHYRYSTATATTAATATAATTATTATTAATATTTATAATATTATIATTIAATVAVAAAAAAAAAAATTTTTTTAATSNNNYYYSYDSNTLATNNTSRSMFMPVHSRGLSLSSSDIARINTCQQSQENPVLAVVKFQKFENLVPEKASGSPDSNVRTCYISSTKTRQLQQ